jgi:GNAT superfamily N-acetyltransferase
MSGEQHSKIRPITVNDLPDLKSVIDSNQLFPADMLDEMTSPFFQAGNETEFWITYQENHTPIAVAYFAPERMTDGTYNCLLIAVHADFQGKQIGKTLMTYIEKFLKVRGHRILLVETSGLPAFERTRNFYLKNNYRIEATVKEFYAKGEDKIIFWKSLKV